LRGNDLLRLICLSSRGVTSNRNEMMKRRFMDITDTGSVQTSVDADARMLTWHVAELALILQESIMAEGATRLKRSSGEEMATTRPNGPDTEVPEEHRQLGPVHAAHEGRDHQDEDGLVERRHPHILRLRREVVLGTRHHVLRHLLRHHLQILRRAEVTGGV